MRFRVVVLSAALLVCALPSSAQQPVTLQFNAGRVTLVTRNAPIRTILAEWARLGGATVVNGERVVGPAMSLELTNVPERQALDVILRGVAGYMLAPRRAGSAGPSTFDRIMILPTSAAPQNPPPAVAVGRPRPLPPRPPVIARPPEVALDAPPDIEIDDPSETDAASPPGNVTLMPRVVGPPVVRQVPDAEPDDTEADPENPGAATPGLTVISTPSNPFGRPPGSSATPGVISPVPRPQQQQGGPANRVQ